MQTRVSTKGQVVLPGPIRRKLDIRAGDPLDAGIEQGRIVLTPRKKATFEAQIVEDPVTGFPDHDYWRPLVKELSGIRAIIPDLRGHGASQLGSALPVGGFTRVPDAPVLTSEQVAEILADFP